MSNLDTLDQQIRDRLLDLADTAGYLTDTIRAVLDLHQPERKSTHPNYLDTRCTACSMREVTSIDYPCPTVGAIADKLGITLSPHTEPRVNQRD